MSDFPPLTIGISSCLLGNNVRFDGGHKRDSFIVDTFSRYASFVSLCPEMEIGLGTPRPPIHWIYFEGDVRVREAKNSQRDHTDALRQLIPKHQQSFALLDGYIVKSKSPSCGLARIKIHQGNADVGLYRGGAFTEALRETYPELPVEDEGRLHDPRLRENFITRVYFYARWRRLQIDGCTKARLLHFHTRHKMLLLAHNEAAYRRLGRYLGAMPEPLTAEFLQRYIREALTALARPSTPKRHTNVLQHALGYFREHLDNGDRQELADAIEHYRQGQVPLSIPVHLFQHHLRRTQEPYLYQQYYFSPHPYALGLYNQI